MSGGKVRGLQLAGAFTGSMIGAGFASGQEHLQFFLAFGSSGYWGLFISGILLISFGTLFLDMAYGYRTSSHREFLGALFSGPTMTLFDIMLTTAILTSVAVMMAGGGALFSTLWGLPPWVGTVLLAVATFLIIALGRERMLTINGVLTLVLTFLVLFVAGMLVSGLVPVEVTSRATAVRQSWIPSSWLGSSTLYAAYNLTFCFSLFGALGSAIHTRRDAWVGGIVGGIVLTVLGIGVTYSVAVTQKVATPGEIPMLMAAGLVGSTVYNIYVFGLWLAMLTTAVTSTYTLVRRIGAMVPWKTDNRDHVFTLVVLGIITPMATVGFSQLVGTAYPLIGYVGGGCLIATTKRFWGGRNRNSRR